MGGPPGAGRPGQGFMPGQELFNMGWQMPTQTLWPGPTFWPPHATPWTQAAQAEASQAAATAAAALYSRGEGGATGPAPGIAGGPGSAPPHLFPGPTFDFNAALSAVLPPAHAGQQWPMMPMVPPAQQQAPLPEPNPADTQPFNLKLRGLPFTATEQDVLAFFAKYEVVQYVADERQCVKMITKSNGKPVGTAVVTMQNKEAAMIAMQELHYKQMGTRYIEVFPEKEDEMRGDQVNGGRLCEQGNGHCIQDGAGPDHEAATWSSFGDTGGSGR